MNSSHDNGEAESQPEETVAGESRQIEIDFHALIDLLSHHLYTDKSAVIRELLSNANDSLIARKREGGFGDEKAMIRIWVDREAAQLVIRDNGIGMSKSDLIEYLSTIGAGLTRKRRADYGDRGDRFEALIGKFGVGFLSSFIVADRIVVETRKPAHQGYRWESRGKREYDIYESPHEDYGTTITLDLKADVRRDWQEEKVKRMVLENARNLIFPIYWGAAGEEKLNDLQAPWYSDKEPGDEDVEAFRSFLVQYDGDRFASADNATEIIPLHAEKIRGVVYVPPLSAVQQEKVGVVDLYCKRVFVTKDYSDVVPPEFGFIKGVVDCFDFQLNVARDDVLRDSYPYRATKEFIGTQIIRHLCGLAEKSRRKSEPDGAGLAASNPERFRLRLQSLMAMSQFHLLVKNALIQMRDEREYRYEDRYLVELEDFIPFQSSQHAYTTIPEYMARKKGPDRNILFLRPQEDFAVHRAISQQEGREFILLQHPVEEEYLKRYSQVTGVSLTSAVDDLKGTFPKLPVTGGWEDIVKFYQERLTHHDFSLSVYLSEFKPESVPGRILTDKDSEGMKRLKEMIKEIEKNQVLPKDDPLYLELAKLEQKSPHILYLNKHNPVLSRIAEMQQKGLNVDLDIILHALFHDIAVAGGRPVFEDHLAEHQARVYAEALDAAGTKYQGKVLEAENRDLRRMLEEARAQISAFSQELEVCRQASAKTAQPTSNEAFFIRPMGDGKDDYDWVSGEIQSVCEKVGLNFIDPKKNQLRGEILQQIQSFLKNSRLVIADVTEVNNPNVFYEIGYVYGMFPEKLVLIGDKMTVDDSKLPFDIKTQAVLKYSLADVPGFKKFMTGFEQLLKSVLAQSPE